MFAAIGAFFVGLFGVFFALDVFWWIGIGVIAICMFNFVENERGGRITFSLIASVVLLYFATNGHAFTWLEHNPFTLLEYAGGYLVVGAFWSAAKWHQLTTRFADFADATKKEFLSSTISRLKAIVASPSQQAGRQGRVEAAPVNVDEQLRQLEAGTIPDEQLSAWASTWRSANSYRHHPFRSMKRPSPFAYKSTIMFWIAFWPWSMISYFIYSFLVDVIEFIWKRLIRVYDAITDHNLKNLDPRLLEKD